MMSLRRFRLKQAKMILRWPGLRPSTMLGMERSRSARLNRISSCGGDAGRASLFGAHVARRALRNLCVRLRPRAQRAHTLWMKSE